MSTLIIEDNLNLTIEYHPTLIETSLEMVLNKHGNGLAIARYSYEEDYSGEYGDAQVFSFIRNAINDFQGLGLYYHKVFTWATSGITLNNLIRNFNNRELYSESIVIESKGNDEAIFIENITKGDIEVKRYYEEPTRQFMSLYDELSKCCKFKSITDSFKWNYTSANLLFERIINKLNDVQT